MPTEREFVVVVRAALSGAGCAQAAVAANAVPARMIGRIKPRVTLDICVRATLFGAFDRVFVFILSLWCFFALK